MTYVIKNVMLFIRIQRNPNVIISQKNLLFQGTIEILNLKGDKALAKRVASVDKKRCVACGVCENMKCNLE